MSWLAWRQFRIQGLAALVFLAAAAVYLGITGSSLHDLFTSSGLTNCARSHGCGPSESSFLSRDMTLRGLLQPLTIALPGIVGIFWGAPLVAREFEHGTHRLAWTQGITRTRWLAVKLTLVGLTAVATTELFTLLSAWWYEPVQKLELDRLSPGVFDTHGIVAIGYASFAFALGLLLGTVIRRTVPAMGLTLLAFIFVRLAGNSWVRPHLASVSHMTSALASGSNIGFQVSPSGVSLLAQTPKLLNDWVLSSNIVERDGATASQTTLHSFLQQHCPLIASHTNGQPPENAFTQCEAAVDGVFHQTANYIAAGQFWTLQIFELAVYVGLAAILIALCFWWLGRRVGSGGFSFGQLFLSRRSSASPSRAASPGAV